MSLRIHVVKSLNVVVPGKALPITDIADLILTVLPVLQVYQQHWIQFTTSSSLNLEDDSDGGEGAFEPDQAPGHLGRQAREETEDQGQEVNW